MSLSWLYKKSLQVLHVFFLLTKAILEHREDYVTLFENL